MATIEPLINLVLSENHSKTLDPKTKERGSKRSTACNITQAGDTKKAHLGFSHLLELSVRYGTLSFFTTVFLLIVPNVPYVPGNPTPAQQAQRKTSRTHSPPSPGNRFNAMGERGEERERTLYGAHLGMHECSQLIPGRENTTLDQAINMCKQGKCVMCGGHNHDLPTSCPSAVGNPTVLTAVRDLMKRRRAVNAAAHKNRK
jgi:hypothetical protein